MRDTVVLASGFGDDGRGGVLAVTDDGVEILDSVPTVGLAFSGGRLARLFRAPGELTGTTELVVYDERGVAEYRRLDAVRDPHDVLPIDDGWLVVSTGTNEIVRVDARGALEPVWRGAGESDAWHVNCLTRGDSMYASAFGEFATFKAWRRERGRRPRPRVGPAYGRHRPRRPDASAYAAGCRRRRGSSASRSVAG